MPRTTDTWGKRQTALFAGMIIIAAMHQAAAQPAPNESNIKAADETSPAVHEGVGGWPKISFNTLASVEYAKMRADSGPGRGPDVKLRLDSTFLAEFNNALSLDGLFQFKSREPLAADDPNRDLFINQGAGRQQGGKMKELYIRYGDYRVGKFVQDFGRAYALLPGPTAADFIEESEEGYEPSDMLGVEKIHVFDDEGSGWRQLSLSAFFFDRTFLHQSFPFNEGMVHYRDGGVGNTRMPENLMATYDVYNMPVGNWAHLNYQASTIRWGKSYGAERSEWWTTLGADISIPLDGSVEDTLRQNYSQLRFYAEGARRDNFGGISGRARNFISASAEYMQGSLVFDLTTTQRWTTDRILPTQKDRLYTASFGYKLPSQTVASLNIAHEKVGEREGVYMGIRLTQTFTLCSRCIAAGDFY